MPEVFDLYYNVSSVVVLSPQMEASTRLRQVMDSGVSRYGRRLNYSWAGVWAQDLPVVYVTAGERLAINSWWSSRSQLTFRQYDSTSGSGAATDRACFISNRFMPISKLMSPYIDLYRGKLELDIY